MKRFECKSCHKLLAKIEESIRLSEMMELADHVTEDAEIKPTTYRQEDLVVHIKCPKCGTMNTRVKETKIIAQV